MIVKKDIVSPMEKTLLEPLKIWPKLAQTTIQDAEHIPTLLVREWETYVNPRMFAQDVAHEITRLAISIQVILILDIYISCIPLILSTIKI